MFGFINGKKQVMKKTNMKSLAQITFSPCETSI
jgi:hypothetical protein